MTALHLACRNGHLEVVKCLLTNGANLSATNKVNDKTIFLLTVCLLLIKLQNVMLRTYICELQLVPHMYV